MQNIASGRQDSNLRPPAPKAGAITGLRYAPINLLIKIRVSQKLKHKYIYRILKKKVIFNVLLNPVALNLSYQI